MQLASWHRRLFVWLLLATVGISAAGSLTRVMSATPPAGDEKIIRIGYLAPLSGVGANDGALMVNGFKLWLDQHGNKMADKPVQVFFEDDKSGVAPAVAACKRLIERDKIDLLSGIFFSPIAYRLAPLMDEAKIPLVISVSAAEDLSQRKRNPWVLRLSWTASQMAQPMGDYAFKKLHYKKVVTVGSDYSHGQEVVGAFQSSFESEGGQVIQKLWLPMDAADCSAVLRQINPNADAIFLCLIGRTSRVVVNEIRHRGIKLPIIASSTTFEEDVLPNVGEEAVGSYSTEPYSAALATAHNQAFVNAYKEKYGQSPCFTALCGYTSAAWINKAVEDMKGNIEDKEAFLKALRNVSLSDDPRGPLKLDAYGTVTQNIYVRQVQKVGSGYQNKVVATYPAVSQFWRTPPEEFLEHPVFSKEYPPCSHCVNVEN